jgi:four helix bundle protein
MEKIRSYKDLKIWILSVDLVTNIYKMTQGFPGTEYFGLRDQMRRASVSVPSNIAEGAGRRTTKDFIQFLSISRGSLFELDTQIVIAKNLGFIENADNISSQIHEIIRMINGLIHKLSSTLPNRKSNPHQH